MSVIALLNGFLEGTVPFMAWFLTAWFQFMQQHEDIIAAIDAKDLSLTAFLIRQGVPLNTSSENGWTPLMLAILHLVTSQLGLFTSVRLTRCDEL